MTLRELLLAHGLVPEDILDSEIYGAVRLISPGNVVTSAELDADGVDIRVRAQPRTRLAEVAAEARGSRA